MLETRIPVPRLVDWIDQAILYLHIQSEAKNTNDSATSEFERLRSCGIRTATDLEGVVAEHPSPLSATLGGDEALSRIQIILDALRDDEWIEYVRHWRKTGAVAAEIVIKNGLPIAAAVEGG